MLTIYGNPMSTCTRKVLCTLAEKNAPFEFSVVDFATGQHKQPAHLAHQPFGQVPAIDDGGFQMYESRAICRYLDETRDGAKLTPADAQGRAAMEQWISVETSNFAPQAMKIIGQLIMVAMRGGTPDMKIVEQGREGVTKAVVVLDAHLAGRSYLVGDSFTLADICYLPYIEYLFACGQGDLITSHANVNAWWERCSARPSWRKAAGKA